jgi:hypothetical protein
MQSDANVMQDREKEKAEHAKEQKTETKKVMKGDSSICC